MSRSAVLLQYTKTKYYFTYTWDLVLFFVLFLGFFLAKNSQNINELIINQISRVYCFLHFFLQFFFFHFQVFEETSGQQQQLLLINIKYFPASFGSNLGTLSQNVVLNPVCVMGGGGRGAPMVREKAPSPPTGRTGPLT